VHHLTEELHAVLLHDDGVGTLAELDESLVGRTGELGKVTVGMGARQIGVPFGMNQQSRSSRLVDLESKIRQLTAPDLDAAAAQLFSLTCLI
jgi:hypothetical protein